MSSQYFASDFLLLLVHNNSREQQQQQLRTTIMMNVVGGGGRAAAVAAVVSRYYYYGRIIINNNSGGGGGSCCRRRPLLRRRRAGGGAGDTGSSSTAAAGGAAVRRIATASATAFTRKSSLRTRRRMPTVLVPSHQQRQLHSQSRSMQQRKSPSSRAGAIGRRSKTTTTAAAATAATKSNKDPQQAAFDYYRRRREEGALLYRLFGYRKPQKNSKSRRGRQQRPPEYTREERNVRVAWYLGAVVVGAVGATYAAVPLYKVFCQTTGFGGTTQRLGGTGGEGSGSSSNKNTNNGSGVGGVMNAIGSTVEAAFDGVRSILVGSAGGAGGAGPSSGTRVHTWTDEDAARRLATLRPVENADLLTVRFDTTVGSDALPWSFVPVQLDVKVVPGETALSFFRVTNHSKKPITGVATYNVHPPKVGLYFTKIQCFCFEEQRLLPGETVDMPVFFFIDPEFCNDPQVSYVRSITLSYTFFPTDEEEEEEE